jgi:hypothetical protein
MALALWNKHLLALLIVAVIAVAVISFLVVGIVLHPSIHHVIAGVIWGG